MNEPTGPSYLVMMLFDLVAQDIALTISDQVPDADVRIVRDADAALLALQGIERVEIAFLAMDPDMYAESELAREVRARGARVVLLGDAAEAAGRGPDWVALIRPFSTSGLLLHLNAKPQ